MTDYIQIYVKKRDLNIRTELSNVSKSPQYFYTNPDIRVARAWESRIDRAGSFRIDRAGNNLVSRIEETRIDRNGNIRICRNRIYGYPRFVKVKKRELIVHCEVNHD